MFKDYLILNNLLQNIKNKIKDKTNINKNKINDYHLNS